MLQRIIILLVLGAFCLMTQAKAEQLALMPYPLSLQQSAGHYSLSTQLEVKITGMSQQRQLFVNRQLNSFLTDYGIELTSATNTSDSADSKLVIAVNLAKAVDYQLPQLGVDESYLLKIDDNGIHIRAANDFGALQAIATLKQLIWSARDDSNIKLPYVTINDMPRFPWRGLLIDSVRHFISVDAIKRQLNGMAAAKLNVFHWHLTDDQGWRVESKSYPKLQQLASDGLYYSQQEIKEIVAYASELGIRVVPEFDLPGHASAIAVAYPELMTRNKPYHMEDNWGVFEPLLDPSNPKTYQFIEAIVAEFSALFPDTYLHIGGDEVNPVQWQQSSAVQQYMQANNLLDSAQLQAHFNQKVQQILAKYHKKMMGWDEIFHPKLARDIMVQSWRGMESLTEIAQAGYQGLLSTGFYIDQPQPTSFHYRNDPVNHDIQLVSPLPEDKVEAWQFSMPRIKGSEVKGKLVLIKRNGYLIHGYVKLNDNHYQKVVLDRRLALTKSQINFSLDSWMGPTRGEFELSAGELLTGRMLIGNSHYSVTGTRLAEFDFAEVKLLPSLNAEQATNILGGEATLWTELVTEHNLDLRIWPRVFAIAERFWSKKSLTNSDNMYQRLVAINEFADSIGLLQLKQQQKGFNSLVFPNTDITPLFMLAQQLEPASYYTRHHLKFRQGLYHQRASLNQFVDFLPVESLQLVQMKQQLKHFQHGNIQGLQQVVDIMRQWHSYFPAVVKLVKRNPKLSSLTPVVQDARAINTIGLTIAQSCLAGVKIRNSEVRRVKNTLQQLHSQVREISLASGLFVEQVLEVCRQ
ncbi:beta-N-acetylhexosaminidase [Thalassotalea insulae]|uniref:N-acetyl-beta-glucosaminidase n=1 Tax=Thalassotalea insulae TaxID=2056778 RepID=A0ABQ6GVW8_9GAMM|nr:family 20 glycosylhydrolase [Thalassotalea insulae]GLX78811.1 beta-N-acetylhexosaminidase [Thalassotalea insulae]